MQKRTTLEDVARLASVSKATASLSLSGKGANKIPQSTRERVRAAADTLQFRPHAVARALVRRRADVLGIVCTLNPFVEMAHHAFEQEMLSSLFYYSLEHGYNPMIYGPPAEENGEQCEDAVLRFADGRSDAFVLLYPAAESALLEKLPVRGIPAVSLCTQIDDRQWVDSDHAAGVSAAMEHLIRLGHRRIAYLTGSHGVSDTHVRICAFREALSDAGIPVARSPIVSWHTDENSAEHRIAELFSGSDAPTALLAWNDFEAGEVFKFLCRLGLNVPRDVSLIGFDDIAAARSSAPPLTTVQQDVKKLARAAVDLALTGLLEDFPPVEPRGVVCPVTLVVRESTAAPATA